MTDTELLRDAERLLAAFEGRLALDLQELRAFLAETSAPLESCLEFLQSRDEILLTAQTPRVFHRRNVLAAVEADLRVQGPSRPAEVATRLALPSSVACEALGWLERDQRIYEKHTDGDVFYCVD